MTTNIRVTFHEKGQDDLNVVMDIAGIPKAAENPMVTVAVYGDKGSAAGVTIPLAALSRLMGAVTNEAEKRRTTQIQLPQLVGFDKSMN